MIDVLIAVTDSEISFVRSRRKKDKIESEKGEGEGMRKRKIHGYEKKQVRDFFVRVSKRRFIFRDFFLGFWIQSVGRGWMVDFYLVTAISFVRSLRETKRENRFDRIRRLDERHAIGSGRRKTRRQVGRFGERRNAEGRRQKAEKVYEIVTVSV